MFITGLFFYIHSAILKRPASYFLCYIAESTNDKDLEYDDFLEQR